MAFSKTLANRFLSMAKIRSPPATTSHRSSLLRRFLPGSGEDQGILRRLFHRRPLFQEAVPPDRLAIQSGDQLIERIRRMNGDRIRLDGLVPPPVISPDSSPAKQRVSMEEVRSRLRSTGRSRVSYSEFLQICCESSSSEQGLGIAKSLDESGEVILMGNVVFLYPDQELTEMSEFRVKLAKAIEGMLPLSLSTNIDPRTIELREMEAKKLMIDRRAEIEVRREMWCGLGFMVLQTAGLMRLTFWELSWDVMEPICFFLTSSYFVVGYGFFMRTSKDPSFEGFFESRFAAKQRKLMRAGGFDLDRFNELRRACPVPDRVSDRLAGSGSYCHSHRRGALLGVAH